MDDVRMYGSALTPTQINQLYTVTNDALNGDCVDTNAAINPLAPEICDGLDNDCDALVDEGLTTNLTTSNVSATE